jgi:hypothetical protein
MAASRTPKSRQPPIVAELGRPETPEESAARRAENSRRHRANQTLLNLIVALVASLGIVLFLVVVVVRPDPGAMPPVDYRAIAVDAQGNSEEPLIAPVLPAGWSANDARFQLTSQVPTWYVGFVTPSVQFIALNQGIGANPTWQAAVLNSVIATGSTSIDGVTWTVYDHRTASNPGNFAYALSATLKGSTVVLHGTASDAEFKLLATAAVEEAGAR